MGYYSEVAFAIDKELYAEHKLIRNDFPEIWETSSQNTDDCIIFYLESIKWYAHFPEIAEAIKLMDHLDAEGLDNRYGFIRLGEQFGDEESRGVTSKYRIYVEQSITIG